MDHREVGRCWDANADAWTKLARQGYDVYRDYLNTPAFFEMLPDVRGLVGLDVGCGEGHNTRLLARRGAHVTAIDVSRRFVGHAKGAEDGDPLGISYAVASGVELPFADETFDFVTGFMSLMDIPEADRVLAEAYRVLKPGAFVQFSISHPCYMTPHRRNLHDERGVTYAIEVGGYFAEGTCRVTEWLFSAAPARATSGMSKFVVPTFQRTLSWWLNTLLDVGFVFERIGEPCPSDEVVRKCPQMQNAQSVADFLHVRVRKP